MTAAERSAAKELFDSSVSIRAFVGTFQACGVGLNLDSADRVYHYDPWWNVQVLRQAEARAHRINSTRAKTITRIIAAGTIEQAIAQRFIAAEATAEIFHQATDISHLLKRAANGDIKRASGDGPRKKGESQFQQLLRDALALWNTCGDQFIDEERNAKRRKMAAPSACPTGPAASEDTEMTDAHLVALAKSGGSGKSSAANVARRLEQLSKGPPVLKVAEAPPSAPVLVPPVASINASKVSVDQVGAVSPPRGAALELPRMNDEFRHITPVISKLFTTPPMTVSNLSYMKYCLSPAEFYREHGKIFAAASPDRLGMIAAIAANGGVLPTISEVISRLKTELGEEHPVYIGALEAARRDAARAASNATLSHCANHATDINFEALSETLVAKADWCLAASLRPWIHLPCCRSILGIIAAETQAFGRVLAKAKLPQRLVYQTNYVSGTPHKSAATSFVAFNAASKTADGQNAWFSTPYTECLRLASYAHNIVVDDAWGTVDNGARFVYNDTTLVGAFLMRVVVFGGGTKVLELSEPIVVVKGAPIAAIQLEAVRVLGLSGGLDGVAAVIKPVSVQLTEEVVHLKELAPCEEILTMDWQAAMYHSWRFSTVKRTA
jgi:hypothetical protein